MSTITLVERSEKQEQYEYSSVRNKQQNHILYGHIRYHHWVKGKQKIFIIFATSYEAILKQKFFFLKQKQLCMRRQHQIMANSICFKKKISVEDQLWKDL